MRRMASLVLCLTAACLFAGCSHVGPRTVSVDRIEYSTAIPAQ
jgi:hypothetical protein